MFRSKTLALLLFSLIATLYAEGPVYQIYLNVTGTSGEITGEVLEIDTKGSMPTAEGATPGVQVVSVQPISETEDTGAPLEEDTGAPLEEDTGAPLEEDTGAPLEEDTGAPLEEDTGAAFGEDTGAPIEEDTGAPIEEDTGAPIEEDTGAPIEEDTGAPLEEDTGAPIEEDTGAPLEEDAGAPVEEGVEGAPGEAVNETAAEGALAAVGERDAMRDTGFWLVSGTNLRRVGNLEINCSAETELLLRWNLQNPWIFRSTNLFVGPSDAAPAGPPQCYPLTHSFDLMSNGGLNRMISDEFTVPINETLLDENMCLHIAAHAKIARIRGNFADNIDVSRPDCCLPTTLQSANETESRSSFFRTSFDGQDFDGWAIESDSLEGIDQEFCGREFSSYDPLLFAANNDWLQFPEFLPQANYLINNRDYFLSMGFAEDANLTDVCSWADIQLVLWDLLNQLDLQLDDSTPECVDAIRADVDVNGADFFPECGGEYLVFIVPSLNETMNGNQAMNGNATMNGNQAMNGNQEMNGNQAMNGNATMMDGQCPRDQDRFVTAIVRTAEECALNVQFAESWGAVRPGGPAKMNPIGSRVMNGGEIQLYGPGTQSFLISEQEICAGAAGGIAFENGAREQEGTGAAGGAEGGDEGLGMAAMGALERAFQWEETQPLFIRFCFPDSCRAENASLPAGEEMQM